MKMHLFWSKIVLQFRTWLIIEDVHSKNQNKSISDLSDGIFQMMQFQPKKTEIDFFDLQMSWFQMNRTFFIIPKWFLIFASKNFILFMMMIFKLICWSSKCVLTFHLISQPKRCAQYVIKFIEFFIFLSKNDEFIIHKS